MHVTTLNKVYKLGVVRGDFAQEYSISARHVRSQARITTVAATRPAMDTADAPW